LPLRLLFLARCLLGVLLRGALVLAALLPGRLLRDLLGHLLLGDLAGGLLRDLLLRGLADGLLRGLLGRTLGGLAGGLLRDLLGHLLLGDLLGDLLLGYLLGGLLARGLLRGFPGRLLGDLLCSFLRGHVMALLVSGLAVLLPSSSGARVSDPRPTAGAAGAPGRIRRGQRDRGVAVAGMQEHLRPGASQVSDGKVVGFRSGDGA